MLNPDAAADERTKVETRIWLQILSLESSIFSRLNRMLTAEFGLSVAKFEFLAQMERYPEGISLGKVSQALKVTSGNVSGLVRRLLADELIEKSMSSEDRRYFIVRFSPKGKALFDRANDRCREELGDCFSTISISSLEDVLSSLRYLQVNIRK